VCEDIKSWFVDSGAYRHMTRMRSVFLSFPEIDLDCHVGCGTSTMHVVKGVGCVIFQLELGGFLEVAEVLLVPELLVNLLSVSSLEDEGCGVVLYRGKVFLYPKGDNIDTKLVLGFKYERLYRLLGYHVCGSSGFLDSESMLVSVADNCEASSSTIRILS
jgi:hypothetical protein